MAATLRVDSSGKMFREVGVCIDRSYEAKLKSVKLDRSGGLRLGCGRLAAISDALTRQLQMTPNQCSTLNNRFMTQ